MNTKLWYLPCFEGVYHIRMFETFSNANACMNSGISVSLSPPQIDFGNFNFTNQVCVFKVERHKRKYNEDTLVTSYYSSITIMNTLLIGATMLQLKIFVHKSLKSLILITVPTW